MPRRSPLCDHCGDIPLQNRWSKILLWLFFGMVLLAISVIITLYVLDYEFMTFALIYIFTIIAFLYFGISYYIKSLETKK